MDSQHTDMLLIPGGSFLMGSVDGNSNELPVHEIQVDSFYLDALVVTNRDFQKFLLAHPEWQKGNVDRTKVDGDYLNLWEGSDFPPELSDYAVINVSWYAASAYAEWVGKRLPTEAEWEYAAGGPEHYKWSLGNTFDRTLYHFGITTDPIGFPVKTHPANGYGLYEMSGGVWEWVRDSYEVDYYTRSPKDNPINLAGSPRKSLRGGSSHFDNPSYLRCAVRGSNNPNACHEDYGFRCALDYRQPDCNGR